jgi:ATP-dependent helicase/nuclease subunit A
MTADRDQRRRAIEETDRSFAVEASAGTGKTSVLIRRILHCVLERGPFGAPLPLSRICAITFTEKAAGEMKIRLRQEFERMAAAGGGQAERARQSLIDLEGAAISTFHSFAVSLLKERPVEAGLDPRFTALDEMQSRLFFLEAWDAWLQRAIAERRPQLEQALRSGIRLDTLRAGAEALRLHDQEVQQLCLPAPPTETEVGAQFQHLLRNGAELHKRNMNPSDKLAPLVDESLAWLADPDRRGKIVKPGTKGAAGNWEGGKSTVESVREWIRTVIELRAQWPRLPVQRALWGVLRLIIDEFLPEWRQRKRASGCLDFDDQLWCAWELLSTSPAARREFQDRYAALLVDEFQDTDPVQWEIIRLLAVSGDGAGGAKNTIAPGRLFIVGDPKQSIYRFRGADIETYADVTGATAMAGIGLDRLELTTNFRSVPSILNFVDHAFRDSMSASGGKPYQPAYLAFGGRGDRVEMQAPPCVHILGDRDEHGALAGSGRDFIAIESSRIAALIASIRDNGDWKVQDRRSREGRAPQLRDIAVLLPVLTHADALEEALRDAGIPYVLEGGRFYYARSEVSSAVTVLRAIANPNDAVALYGALRSIFFGVSDEELLRSKADGIPLDYRAQIPADARLCHPYCILRELHRLRHTRTAAETLECLLQQTGAREVLAVRGIQSLANLHKLVRTLRALQQEATFSEVVDLVGSMDEEGAAESESRIMEEHSDAVRILSIHRAKGLDFPVVIAAGLGMQRRSRSADFLADRHVENIIGLNLGSKDSGLQTRGWDRLLEAEKEREDAELTRLLYVALTRARDHLVVSTHMRGRKAAETGRWEAYCDSTRLKPLAAFLSGLSDRGAPIARLLDAGGPAGAVGPKIKGADRAQGTWSKVLQDQYDQLERLLSLPAAPQETHPAPSGAGEWVTAESDSDSARERAVRLGVAFHEAMESADFSGDADPGELAGEAGARQRLDGAGLATLREMLRCSLASDLLARARESLASGRRLCRELPYVCPGSSGPAGAGEGKIDLLFEEANGWVVVDYKTDRVPAGAAALGALAEKYGGQVQAYVKALVSLGMRVKAAYLLLARTGGHIEIPVHTPFLR